MNDSAYATSTKLLIVNGPNQHYEIKIIKNPEEIIKELISLNERSNEIFTCTMAGGMQLVYTYLFNVNKNY